MKLATANRSVAVLPDGRVFVRWYGRWFSLDDVFENARVDASVQVSMSAAAFARMRPTVVLDYDEELL